LPARERTYSVPKVSLREKYRKRFVLKRKPGQNWFFR